MVLNATLTLQGSDGVSQKSGGRGGGGGGKEPALYLTLNTHHHQNDCYIEVGSWDGMLM